MSWFFKAGLTGLAVACLFVLAAVTALARYPYDNGNHYGQLWNPGHHYGQLKHAQNPPVPTPAPTPTPTPNRGTQPAGGGSPAVVPGAHKQGAGGTDAGTTSGVPDLPVTLPAGGPSDEVSFTDTSAPSGPLDWLLLLLVPALAALWVLSGARTAQRASQRWARKTA